MKYIILLILFLPSIGYSQGFPEKNILDGTEKLFLFAEPSGNKYVTTQNIANLTSPLIFGNGLTNISGTVGLGGTLGYSTLINGDEYPLSITNMGDFYVQANSNMTLIGTAVTVNGNATVLTGFSSLALRTVGSVSGDVTGKILQSQDADGEVEYTPYTLPLTAGTLNEILKVDASGNLVYSVASGSVGNADSLNNQAASYYENYWTKTGNDLSYVTGNVGIGVIASTARLDVGGAVTGLYVRHPNNNEITVRYDNYGSTGVNAGPLFRMFNQGGTTMVNIDTRQGSGRYTYFNANNVGFGTTVPAQKLEVIGNAKISNKLMLGTTSDNVYLESPSAGEFGLSTNNVERMRFDAGGNVGIGTSDLLNNRFRLASNYLKTDITPRRLMFISTSEADHPFGLAMINVGAASNSDRYIKLQTSEHGIGDGGNLVLQIQGNVGIGTTSPSEKLEVEGNSKFSNGTNDITIGGNLITFNTNYVDWEIANNSSSGKLIYSPVGELAKIEFGRANSNDLQFEMSNSSGVSKNLVTTSGSSYFNGGNVGLGTTSPTENLDIYETASPTLALTNAGGMPYGTTLQSKHDSNDKFKLAVGGIDVLGYIGPNEVVLNSYADLSFRTGGTTVESSNVRLHIEQTGNVGIGTITPDAKLHIVGNAKISEKVMLGTTSDNVFLESPSAGEFGLSTNNVERLRVDLNGNVGIGTTAPTDFSGKVLQVHADAGSAARLKLTNTISGTATSDGGSINFDTSNDLSILNRETGNIILGTSALERLRITPSGNVGIGTTAPSSKLHVALNTSAGVSENLRLSNLGGGGNEGTSVVFSSQNNQRTGAVTSLRNGGNLSNHLTLSTGDNDILSERLRIASDGNVGIGTTSPTEKLEVGGNIKNDGYHTFGTTFPVDGTGVDTGSTFKGVGGALYYKSDGGTVTLIAPN